MVPALTTCITPSGEARTCASKITTASSLVDKVKEQNQIQKVTVYSKCVFFMPTVRKRLAPILDALSIRIHTNLLLLATVLSLGCLQVVLPLLCEGAAPFHVNLAVVLRLTILPALVLSNCGRLTGSYMSRSRGYSRNLILTSSSSSSIRWVRASCVVPEAMMRQTASP